MLSAERAPRQLRSPFARTFHSASNIISRNMCPQPEQVEHIWIITGPAGCGKTTVAQFLAQQLSLPYIEGDDYHPAENKRKMGSGTPLTDADRWDWLITLRKAALEKLQNSNSVIVTCSALKQKYRDVIRVANYEHPSVQVHFVYLKVDEQTLQNRVAARVGHYMKADMVQSQMNTLEEPENDLEWDVIQIDVRQDREAVQHEALAAVQKKLTEYDNTSS